MRTRKAGTAQTATPEPDQSTRDRILSAAGDVFLRHGYEAKLAEIADEAGLTRQTIYVYFKDKDQLFKEALRRLTHDLMDTFVLVPGKDPFETLLRVAISYRTTMLGPREIELYRVTMSDTKRFEGFGQEIYEEGGQQMLRVLESYIASILPEGSRGLSAANLAEAFLALCLGVSRERLLVGLDDKTEKQSLAFLRNAVAMFIAGIGL